MYPRIFKNPSTRSFFLFGPRGTGKSSWLRSTLGSFPYIDLLKDDLYRTLLARPERIEQYLAPKSTWVVIDEVQRVPDILNEVHRLIETRDIKFALSGSSARKLKSKGVNLLAGRALTCFLFPLTIGELGNDFNLKKALLYGMLPEVWDSEDFIPYLKSYITTYLKEEIQQEGLTRNLGSFSRFLEIASFSQAAPLNVSKVAQDVGIDSKTAENYFTILEDLLLASRVPVFSKHSKRDLYKRSKFFYFDVGVYRQLRPKGPLDTPELIDGAALETLLFQELNALNSYHGYEYEIFYWRTKNDLEIDFILYGPRGLVALEIKRTENVRKKDLKALKTFKADYSGARPILLYGGREELFIDDIEVIPYNKAIQSLDAILKFENFRA